MRQLEADYSIGESEQKVEMTFGDFGAPVSASALPAGEVYAAAAAGEVYVPHPYGGIVGFGFRAALSRGSAG